jgi:hypothetical protein
VTYVVTTIIDVVIVLLGIGVLAVLFRQCIVMTISLIRASIEKTYRRFKGSISILKKNDIGSNKFKLWRSTAGLQFEECQGYD